MLNITLDRDSPHSLFHQLRRQLTIAIRSGAVAVGARLPPIRTLAQQLGINRNTVHKVYASLERAQLVRSRTGDGTYVAEGRAGSILPAEVTKAAELMVDNLVDRGVMPADIRLAFDAAMMAAAQRRGKRETQVMQGRRQFANRNRFLASRE